MKLFFLFAFGTLGAVAAIPASATQMREARCVIRSHGATYRGNCIFLPEDMHGSFSAGPADSGTFFGDIEMVSVTIVRRAVAEVRGSTAGGVNSRWGRAVRSRRDRACWIGDDFSVCAY